MLALPAALFAPYCDLDPPLPQAALLQLLQGIGKVEVVAQTVDSATRSASIVFDEQDEVTGLKYRMGWSLRAADDGRFDSITFVPRVVLTPPQPGMPSPAVDRRLFEFGFQPIDPRSELSARARAAVESTLGRGLTTSDPRQFVANKHFVFVPEIWVGCSGYLVRCSDSASVALASPASVDLQLWAHYQGALLGWFGEPESNDLIVDEVRDLEAARSILLGSFERRFFEKEVRPVLERPPGRIANISLWPHLRELKTAQLMGWLQFRFQPGSGGAV